jgi:hypothetical protein
LVAVNQKNLAFPLFVNSPEFFFRGSFYFEKSGIIEKANIIGLIFKKTNSDLPSGL